MDSKKATVRFYVFFLNLWTCVCYTNVFKLKSNEVLILHTNFIFTTLKQGYRTIPSLFLEVKKHWDTHIKSRRVCWAFFSLFWIVKKMNPSISDLKNAQSSNFSQIDTSKNISICKSVNSQSRATILQSYRFLSPS